jgi:hypothetical protein
MKAYRVLTAGLFFVINLILLTACTGSSSTTVTTIYLQEASAYGPINQAPVHLTEEAETPSFTVSPRFSYKPAQQITGSMSGHTPVNSEGNFQVDTTFYQDGTISFQQTPGANIYEYEGNNLTWDIASITAGFDFDARITKAFAAFAGVNYSSASNKNVWGGSLGLALLLATNKLGLRLDAGFHVQSIAYDAYTVENVQTTTSRGTYEYVVFYHDIGRETQWDPFINLTINSASPRWFVNFFLNIGYSEQTLVAFTPKDEDEEYYYNYGIFGSDYHHEIVEDLRGKGRAGYVNVTPGLFFRLGRSSRILVGARFFFETVLDDATESTFILPMIQADFMF